MITFGDGAFDALRRTVDGFQGWLVEINGTDYILVSAHGQCLDDACLDVRKATDPPPSDVEGILWTDVKHIHVY